MILKNWHVSFGLTSLDELRGIVGSMGKVRSQLLCLVLLKQPIEMTQYPGDPLQQWKRVRFGCSSSY